MQRIGRIARARAIDPSLAPFPTRDGFQSHAEGVLVEDNDEPIVMTGLVPVIHVVELPETLGTAGNGATWMTGTSPVMTKRAV
jgi:hypothetical protein